MQRNDALGVVGLSPFLHIRVITEMKGDGTVFGTFMTVHDVTVRSARPRDGTPLCRGVHHLRQSPRERREHQRPDGPDLPRLSARGKCRYGRMINRRGLGSSTDKLEHAIQATVLNRDLRASDKGAVVRTSPALSKLVWTNHPIQR